jgi:hypothetical protein
MKPAVRRALLTTALGLTALAAQPAAHAQDATRAFAEGSHVFRRILFDADCTPLKDFKDVADDPTHTILIVLGETRCLARLPLGVDQFVQRGGALLLASDQQITDVMTAKQVENVSGVALTGQTRRHDPRNVEACYRRLQFCPFVVTDERRLLISQVARKLFVDSRGNSLQVATNVPGALSRPRNLQPLPDGVEALAHLPRGFGFRSAFAAPWITESTLFAVGGDVQDGRVLVLADHSIFINEMMLPDDNSNVEFTTNCVNWLRGDDRRRTKALFVEDGRIRDSFDIPLKYETLPLDKAVAAAVGWADQQLVQLNQKLGREGGQAGTNRFLQQWLADKKVPMDNFGEVLVYAMTVTLLLYGCYRVGVKGRHRIDYSVPLLSRALQKQATAQPLMGQRQEALLQSGNLWETARELARQCFASAVAPSAAPPRVVAVGGWWNRRRARARVRRLWRLAHSGRPERVRSRRLKGLLAEIERLKGELQDGTVRLVSDAEPKGERGRSGAPRFEMVTPPGR